MLPTVALFSRSVPSYGLLTAIGCLLAVAYLKLTGRGRPEHAADIELVMIYGLIGAFVGAKLLYLVTVVPGLLKDISCLFSNPADFLSNYLGSGFVFYGGFYGCIFAVWLYCTRRNVPFSQMMRFFLPAVPLVHMFGRIGCFFTGCCYGSPAAPPYGIAFSCSEIAPNGIPLFPVQLYEAAVELCLFIHLTRMSRGRRSGIQMLLHYAFLYSIARFLLEYLRGDDYRGFLGPFSTSQVIAILTILIFTFSSRPFQRGNTNS